ncbi:hypothetical protein [Burkholderia cepacia]|uniref:hypothetical protein n=1 Tax=Burkholderia cepacia TaxID=292 RepID=UPI001F21758D|nr:hypothetical protein [Burkholderia cepacia]MCE4125786.1 hypothetical protein [Burkholderia cepacia]
MKKFLVTHEGRGKELQEMLRKEFAIPDTAMRFSVEFRIDDVVRVSVDYMPVAREESKA